MSTHEKKIKEEVKKHYGKIAEGKRSGCCGGSSCCGSGQTTEIGRAIGYQEKEMESVPKGANLGLGCGNPTALASIKEGEIVLDLGSGAGFDAFLASQKVGTRGKVIGVDMTPSMVARAKSNAKKGGYANVEFRLGEIENLPIENKSVDLIISNCVINLSPDKEKVFKESYRVLKNGGRIMVSDLVLAKSLPEKIRKSVAAYVGCIAGAMMEDEYLNAVKKVGFSDVRVMEKTFYPVEAMANDATSQLLTDEERISAADLKSIGKSVLSIKVQGFKS
jgi:arsenite methyltransferase